MSESEATYTCEDCGAEFTGENAQNAYASHRAHGCDGTAQVADRDEPPSGSLAETVHEVLEAHPDLSEAAQGGDESARNKLAGTVMDEMGVGPATAESAVTRALGGTTDEPAAGGVDVDGFTDWIEGKAARGERSEWTADAYTQSIQKFDIWYDEHRDPDLPPARDDVAAWCRHLAEVEELAGSTIQRHFHGVSAYFEWLERETELAGLSKKVSDQYPNRSGGSKEYFPWEDIEALREAASTAFDRAVVQIFTGFGIRIGELVALDVDDVDFGERALYVHRQKRTSEWTDAMHLLDEDAQVIRNWLMARDDLGEAADEDALFVTPRASRGGDHPATTSGYRASPTHIRTRLKDLAEEAGIDPDEMYPHKLRHSVGTKLGAEGYAEMQIQRYLGHTAQTSTEGYVHMTPETFRKMREALA